MTKRCFKCRQTKPLGEFYAHPMMADGHLNKCKTYTKLDVRDRRLAEPEKLSAYEKQRNSTFERRQQFLDGQRRRRSNHPEKARAYNIVRRALITGWLVRPSVCPVCNEPRPVQAHHADYSRPLDIEWLCFRCHRERRHGQVVVAAETRTREAA